MDQGKGTEYTGGEWRGAAARAGRLGWGRVECKKDGMEGGWRSMELVVINIAVDLLIITCR